MSDVEESNHNAARRKKIGPKVGTPDMALLAEAHKAAKESAEAPALSPRLYVVFYYEDKFGDTGFDHVVLEGIIYIKSQNDLVRVNQAIAGTKDDPSFYAKICVTNWHLLEN